MKKVLLLPLLFLLAAAGLRAQTNCNATGNMIIYSNYDGGTLNINVDVNIPNLRICVTSYEAVAINISGLYASNVVSVRYAGYNSTNNTNCTPSVSTTTITGAPTTATTSIVFAPSSPVTNTNGYPSIICNYSCSSTTNQGGCNTPDQIAAYFQNQFPTATIRYHKTQYNCWTSSGSQTVSGAGNCCIGVTVPTILSINATATAINCFGACTSTATAVAAGGTAPYTYQWTGGPATATWTNRCAGTYYVSVTDAANTVKLDTVVITQPPLKASTLTQTACVSYNFFGTPLTASGQYKDTLPAANGCDSVITLNLTITPVNVAVTQAGAVLTAAAAAPATYQWVLCAGTAVTLVSGATAKTYTATQNGQYAVIVSQNGCSDTSACVTVSSVGIGKPDDLQKAISVYPNPLQGDYFVISAPAGMKGAAYTLTDGTGRTVAKGKIDGEKTGVRAAGLAAGVYLLRVAGQEGAVQVVR